jgi:peptidoglycan/xylan/chitin deacetylase (PgdA/CDA1 family)
MAVERDRVNMKKFVDAPMRRWIVLLALLVTGCAATEPVVVPDASYYASEDYVIYKLKPGDTAASVAAQFLGDARKAWAIEDANRLMAVGKFIIVPLKLKNIGGICDNGFQTVPILCYHRFGDGCDSPLCVSAELFDHQMGYLRNQGYRVITPEQMLDFLSYRQAIPKKSVMITIDDGYRSVYDVAYPILKKYGYTATLFVYTDYVGVSSKAITWRQLRELKSNGFTIGSHTIMHSDLSKKGDNESDTEYKQRLHKELFDSKKIIDNALDQNTFFFAYPFGRVNPEALEMTREAGYRLAVTVNRGGNPFFSNALLLQRDMILKKDMATFKRRLKTFESFSLR